LPVENVGPEGPFHRIYPAIPGRWAFLQGRPSPLADGHEPQRRQRTDLERSNLANAGRVQRMGFVGQAQPVPFGPAAGPDFEREAAGFEPVKKRPAFGVDGRRVPVRAFGLSKSFF
jgi:hypothetical protein